MDGHSARDERVELIGREREIALVEQRLTKSRLVTIAGLGGIGKTSLAREIAERSEAAGVSTYFVDLAPVAAPTAVSSAIAEAVGAENDLDGGLVAAVASSLTGGPSLLVLDNFEHVLAAAPIVSALLDHAPGARVLATSRVPLGAPSESVVGLAPLAVPSAAAEVRAAPAGALFLERMAVHGHRPGAEDDLTAVVEICRRLDGVPLAIELAAGWTGILTPRAVARRLLDGRLDLASDDPRHASLEAVVDSTLTLLDPRSRDRFASLGAFAGPFDEPAADAVLDAADALTTLRTLADAALVKVSADADGEPRFELLETIRAVALDRLNASDVLGEVFARHVEHYAGRAVAAADAVRSSSFSDPRAGARLADPNLLVAFDRAVSAGRGAEATRLAASLATRAMQTGILREALGRLRIALALDGTPPADRASGMNALVSVRGALGESGDQPADAARAVELAREADDPVLLVRALITLGNWSADGRRAAYAEGARIAEAAGYDWGAATCWLSLGDAEWTLGNEQAALDATLFGLEASRRTSDQAGVATALSAVGEYELNLGRVPDGVTHLAEAATILRARPGVPFQLTLTLAMLAVGHSLGGDQPAAYRVLAEAAERVEPSEVSLDPVNWIEAASTVLRADHPVAAARALGAHGPAVEAEGRPAVSRRIHGATARELETALGRARFGRERAAGEAAGIQTTFRELSRIVRREAGPGASVIRGQFGALTRREQEILRHLADGRTDREIADALGISAKTASVHVANLKAKLGVATRVEAALFARERLGEAS